MKVNGPIEPQHLPSTEKRVGPGLHENVGLHVMRIVLKNIIYL